MSAPTSARAGGASEIRRPSSSKPTALYDVHVELGAQFTDFAGWLMPLRYKSELAEHHAVRNRAGLFDLSHMGEVEVVGPQASALLDYALVSDIGSLAITKARYTMICRPDGGILDDLIVYRLGQHRYMVVANAANSEAVLDALRRRGQGFDAAVHDTRDQWVLIAIQGPHSTVALQPITDVDLAALRYYTIAEGRIAGKPARLARTGYTGEHGYEVFCAPDDAIRIWAALAATGADHGVVPAGLACRDSLRLEAGMPLYGNELTEKLTPFEVGLGRVISFGKAADFVGREALAAKAELPMTKVRVGLLPKGRRTPRGGSLVLEPVTRRTVGWVTSGAPSPTLGYPVAMAYVNASLAAPGTPVLVDVRGTEVDATVAPLPFYNQAN